MAEEFDDNVEQDFDDLEGENQEEVEYDDDEGFEEDEFEEEETADDFEEENDDFEEEDQQDYDDSEDNDEEFDKPVAEGETVELEIEDLGSKGDGIARVEGFVVFVPGGEVGESYDVEITSVGRKFAFGEIEE